MAQTWGQLGDRLITLATEKRVPISGQFELTSRCNLQCKMCYICNPVNDKKALSHERSAREWIRLAEEARDAGMLYLLLTGGEIFLRKDFKEIYEEISRMGFCIELYTNATMIKPETAKWLGRIPPSKVGVTLYGASSQMYSKVCGSADAYEQAVRGIDLLLDEGINVDLKTTVVRDNIEDFDRISEFAEKRELDFGIVNYISPRREGNNTNPVAERLAPQELVEYEKHAENYFENKEGKSYSNEHKEGCLLEYKKSNIIHSKEIESPYSCSVGKCSFWVTWDGNMTTCGILDEPVSFPFEKGFLTAWKDLQNLCASTPECDECKKCSLKEYCLSCPARLKSETGYYDKPAPYLCELAQKEKNWRNS